MNKEWSIKNKEIKELLKKKETLIDAILKLIAFRKELFNEWKKETDGLDISDYSKQPLINSDGYDSKTIAYSIYHVFRIEDIVLHTLIKKEEEIYFKENFQTKMNSKIITTGNELYKKEIEEFSQNLNIDELWNYAKNVYEESNKWLLTLTYEDLKIKYNESDKERIKNKLVVDESQNWLIDYWCGKNISGLLQMPFSRHWIMHLEASIRIKNKILLKK